MKVNLELFDNAYFKVCSFFNSALVVEEERTLGPISSCDRHGNLVMVGEEVAVAAAAAEEEVAVAAEEEVAVVVVWED